MANSDGTTKKVVHRNSVDGQFVKKQYAETHKRTTEREVVKVPSRAPKKSS